MAGIAIIWGGVARYFTSPEYTVPNGGTARLNIKYSNSTLKFGFTSDSSASQYSPKIRINGKNCYIGRSTTYTSSRASTSGYSYQTRSSQYSYESVTLVCDRYEYATSSNVKTTLYRTATRASTSATYYKKSVSTGSKGGVYANAMATVGMLQYENYSATMSLNIAPAGTLTSEIPSTDQYATKQFVAIAKAPNGSNYGFSLPFNNVTFNGRDVYGYSDYFNMSSFRYSMVNVNTPSCIISFDQNIWPNVAYWGPQPQAVMNNGGHFIRAIYCDDEAYTGNARIRSMYFTKYATTKTDVYKTRSSQYNSSYTSYTTRAYSTKSYQTSFTASATASRSSTSATVTLTRSSQYNTNSNNFNI